MRTGSVVAALVFLLAQGQMVWADVIIMKSGRQFEGRVLEETDSYVKGDVMVGGIRVTASADRAKVASIERKPLPDGFFNASSVAASKPTAFPVGSTPYLVVPFTGTIGTDITPAGINCCMNYASGHSISHVVFIVDSQGGDLEATRAIRKILAFHSGKLTYHCIVRKAEGESMIVPIFCRTVFVNPNSSLGGVKLVAGKNTLIQGQSLEMFKAQAAREAGEYMESRGFPGGVVRAMIDPTFNMSAWVDDEKKIHLAASRPPEVSKDNVIFSDTDPNEVLTLSGTQAARVKLARTYTGDASGLGNVLELPKWTSAGNRGAEIMAEAAVREAQRKRTEAAEYENAVQRNIQRRETAKAYITSNMNDAEKYDPSKDSKYAQSRAYTWNDNVIISSDPVANEYTDRAAVTIRALNRASAGIRELLALEKQAEKLDLAPMSSPAELANQLNSNDVRLKLIARETNRRSHIISE
jgi:hypothetical protein